MRYFCLHTHTQSHSHAHTLGRQKVFMPYRCVKIDNKKYKKKKNSAKPKQFQCQREAKQSDAVDSESPHLQYPSPPFQRTPLPVPSIPSSSFPPRSSNSPSQCSSNPSDSFSSHSSLAPLQKIAEKRKDRTKRSADAARKREHK